MSGLPGAVDEQELHALVDGRLAAERAAGVDAYLAAHPEAREQVRQYADQRQRLREAVGELAKGPMPARLGVARILAARRRRHYRRLFAAAAAVLLLVVGAVLGWNVRNAGVLLASWGSGGRPSAAARAFTADAVAAYRVFSVEVRHPVEVDAGHEAHLVQWLSKRLGRPLVVPNLTEVGFQLMGGRLLPSENGPAAQLMYEDGKGARLTCYYEPVGFGVGTEFRYSQSGGVGTFYWSEEGFGYAIAGRADRGLLLKVAEIVYRQVSDNNGKAKNPTAPGKPS